VKKVKNVAMTELQGGGSLKASLLKVLRLVKSDQGHSDQVIKEWCHAECSFCHAELRERAEAQSENHAFRSAVTCESNKNDSASYQLGVLQGSQQHQILKRVQDDSVGRGGFLTGLMARRNDNSVGRSERGLTLTKKFKHSQAQVEFLSSPNGEGKVDNFHNDLITWSLDHLITSKRRKVAFTMAEILLSLTIIGVVAAITLPSLTGNINERTWNTQRKALYARMSQALSLMPNMNMYGSYTYTDNGNGSYTATEDTAAETFLTAGLSKVLKINNICDAEHIADCGISSAYTNMAGSPKTWSSAPKLSDLNSAFTSAYTASDGTVYQNPQKAIDTKAAAFETANGESILTFYNPYCTADDVSYHINWYSYSLSKMCVNFIYDLNGVKGPNTVGKDVGFMSVLYPTDSIVVAPMPLLSDAGTTTHNSASKLCTSQDSESRLPNREELASIGYNKELVGIASGGYWASTVFADINGEIGAWCEGFAACEVALIKKNNSRKVRCIKR